MYNVQMIIVMMVIEKYHLSIKKRRCLIDSDSEFQIRSSFLQNETDKFQYFIPHIYIKG